MTGSPGEHFHSQPSDPQSMLLSVELRAAGGVAIARVASALHIDRIILMTADQTGEQSESASAYAYPISQVAAFLWGRRHS